MPIESLYQEPPNTVPSLANQIKDLKQPNIEDLQKSFNDNYLEQLRWHKEDIETDIENTDNQDTIINNAALLIRYKIEAEIMLNSMPNQKVVIMNSLFDDNPIYQELCKQYYGEDEKSGLVKKVQDKLKEIYLGCDGLFNDSYDIKQIAHQPNDSYDVKQIAHQPNDSYDVKQTAHQPAAKYKKVKNISANSLAAINIAIKLSDPCKLGTICAILGDPANKGEIKIPNNSLKLGKNTMSGIGHSSIRAIFCLSLLILAIAAGFIIVPHLLTFACFATFNPACLGMIVAMIIGGTMGPTFEKHIKDTVADEKSYTQHITNISDNIRYVIGPTYEGQHKDQIETLGIQEKKLYNRIVDTIDKNQNSIQKLNSCKSFQDRLKSIKVKRSNMLSMAFN